MPEQPFIADVEVEFDPQSGSWFTRESSLEGIDESAHLLDRLAGQVEAMVRKAADGKSYRIRFAATLIGQENLPQPE